MRSLGENEITVNANIVGKVRVLGIAPDSTVFPRLSLRVGVTLHDRPPSRGSNDGLVGYEMRDMTGELRLLEHGDNLSSALWAGPRRFVRSSSYGGENEIRLTCDLDFWRLEQIERRRDGGHLKLWLQLWPVLVHQSAFLDVDCRPIQVDIPRDDWLCFYTTVGGGAFEIVEIHFSQREAEALKRATARAKEARGELLNGNYDKAVALCRHVIDALRHELPQPPEGDPLRDLLLARTDERRGGEYASIVSRLKQLSGFAHHEFGTPLTYSRPEAQFILRLTEAFLALFGALTEKNGS